MDVRETLIESPDYGLGRDDDHDTRGDAWVGQAAVLDGPRRTCFVLLERLEQSRAILRDLTARLRRP